MNFSCQQPFIPLLLFRSLSRFGIYDPEVEKWIQEEDHEPGGDKERFFVSKKERGIHTVPIAE